MTTDLHPLCMQFNSSHLILLTQTMWKKTLKYIRYKGMPQGVHTKSILDETQGSVWLNN